MRQKALFVFVLASCVMFSACSNSSMSTPPPANAIPMSLTIGDTPPGGVAVLFFEALITGVSLQPSDPKKPTVTLMITPTEVEFTHLQTDTAFLNLANVAPDTFKSMTLTFGTATMTIVNHSPAAIGSCAINAVCQISPSFNPSTATLTSAPFPITISANSVVGIRLDFNLNSSVQSDLSINPTVKVTHFIQRHEDEDKDEMEEIDEVSGQVTGVGTNQFTLKNERTGQSFTINTDSSTRFEDFDRAGCTAMPEDLTCVKTGQILEVNFSESGTGSMLAKRVELEENAARAALKGTITSVDSGTQFHMVVFNEETAVNGVSEGSPVTVTIQTGATFQIGGDELEDDGGFSIAGLSFASGADLLVGQDVQIRPGTVSTGEGVTTVTTDLVRLRPSQISGKVGTVNTNGTFTLTGLSPLFTGATPPITAINVVTLSEMDFMGFASAANSVATGNSVSVRGLLFKGATATPTLVTRAVRDHDGE